MNTRLSRACLLQNPTKQPEKLEKSAVPAHSQEKLLETQKKFIENSLIFNGFYKKTFKERLDQVNPYKLIEFL